MPSLWDHDLWESIYAVPDPQIKGVLVNLYRLVLDMRESDVFAKKVADQINKRDKLVLSVGQRAIGILLSGLLVTDTILHIVHHS